VNAVAFTSSAVEFIGVVSAVIVTITHVPFWDTQSTGWTLKLTGAAFCIITKHDIQITSQGAVQTGNNPCCTGIEYCTMSGVQ